MISPTEKRAKEKKIPWNKGIKTGISWNRGKKGLQVAWNKDKKCPQLSGENHGAWMGENAAYVTKHKFLTKTFGHPFRCENPDCIYPRKTHNRHHLEAPKRFEWALIQGRSYSRSREDYMMLCPSCHRKYDSRHERYRAFGQNFDTNLKIV